MRGGSTFFSELFNQSPDVSNWFEPYSAFFMEKYGMKDWTYPLDVLYHDKPDSQGNPLQRPLPDWEQIEAINFHNKIMNCDYEELSLLEIAHTIPGSPKRKGAAIRQFTSCVFGLNVTSNSCIKTSNFVKVKQSLLYDLSGICGKTYSKAAKAECSQKIACAMKRYPDVSYRQIHPATDQQCTFYSAEQLKPFYKHIQCQNDVKRKVVEHCLSDFVNSCKSKPISSYKGLRITMNLVGSILEQDPQTRVTYMIRDPRAIVLSRLKADRMSQHGKGTDKHLVTEARYLCHKMTQDLHFYNIYKTKYPGAIKMVKYEDVASEPIKMAHDIYEHIGRPIHNDVLQWINGEQTGVDNGGVFSTSRSNWTSSINKWRQSVSTEIGTQMTFYCSDVLNALGYNI